MRKIDKIVVHCSASEFGNAIIIDDWHRQRGWKMIGYTYVILNGQIDSKTYRESLNGSIECGRPEEMIPSHVRGHNSNSIGICLIGNNSFTVEQMNSLAILLEDLINLYNLEPKDIYGHCEFDSRKTCPNFDVQIIRDMFTKVN